MRFIDNIAILLLGFLLVLQTSCSVDRSILKRAERDSGIGSTTIVDTDADIGTGTQPGYDAGSRRDTGSVMETGTDAGPGSDSSIRIDSGTGAETGIDSSTGIDTGVDGGITCVCSVVNECCDGCLVINENGSCDDGDACNVDEACQNGVCTGGSAVDCSGTADQCSDDYSCDPQGAEGNCDTPDPINEDDECDDGDVCNIGETCQSGVCTGGDAVDCSGTADQCNDDYSCDPAGPEGNCDTPDPIREGLDCDDNNACNIGETCQSGVCTGGGAVDCSGTAHQCSDDYSCNPAGAEGNCDAPNPIREGLDCDDGVFCNGTETCVAGACTSSGDPCAANPDCQDVCDEDGDTCTIAADMTPCNDDQGNCSQGVCCPGVTTLINGKCDLGLEDNIVFVTSQAYPGNITGAGGLGDADAQCNALASAAGLAGTYHAWLSTSTVDARDRISDGPFFVPQGQLVADDVADLTDGSLSTPISFTEDNSDFSPTGLVWTGTAADGTALADRCVDWSSEDFREVGQTGAASQSNDEWTATNFTRRCYTARSLYCFQDDCPGLPEVDFETDPDNCGECGQVCATGTCISGECAATVFLSSVMYTGISLRGLAGADAECQTLADAVPALAGLTWTAWLSDAAGNAVDRVVDQPYVLTDGMTLVASSLADLTDITIQKNIHLDENQTSVGVVGIVWTGTQTDGIVDGAFHCNNWSPDGLNGTYGIATHFSVSAGQWTDIGQRSCTTPARIYCFQN